MFDWSAILPAKRNDYDGHPLAFYFLVLIGFRNVFRGCVHYFAPDGGAGIIAGIPLESYSHAAVQVIINGFGAFGVMHLLEAVLVWLVILRYRALIPMVFVFMLAGQLLVIALLAVKPLPVVPPGQIAAYVLLPITFASLLLSVRKRRVPSGAALAS